MGNSSPYLFEKYYRFVFVKKSKEFISTHDRSLSAEEELKKP